MSQALSAMASLGKAMGGNVGQAAASSMMTLLQAGLAAAKSSGNGVTPGQAADALTVMDAGGAASSSAATTGAGHALTVPAAKPSQAALLRC